MVKPNARYQIDAKQIQSLKPTKETDNLVELVKDAEKLGYAPGLIRQITNCGYEGCIFLDKYKRKKVRHAVAVITSDRNSDGSMLYKLYEINVKK